MVYFGNYQRIYVAIKCKMQIFYDNADVSRSTNFPNQFHLYTLQIPFFSLQLFLLPKNVSCYVHILKVELILWENEYIHVWQVVSSIAPK